MTMTHQKQSRNECAFATIAILTNQPLDCVLSTGAAIYNLRYRDKGPVSGSRLADALFSTEVSRFWFVLNKVCDFYKMPYFHYSENAIAGMEEIAPPDIQRKAQVTVKFSKDLNNGELWIGYHSIAVGDGKVFDPNLDGPLESWQDYQTEIALRGYTMDIVGVNYLP